MFQNLKKQVQVNFNELAKHGLFYIAIDRDLIFERYIGGFSDETMQSHNCNCCKSFLRQYGGIVAIIENKVVSIWDNIDAGPEYAQTVKNLKEYVHSLPITDVFFTDDVNCGTDVNFSIKHNHNWEHFYLALPTRFVVGNLDTVRGKKRESKDMLERALQELTIDATQTILDLIAQKSLYRGNEFENSLKVYLHLQKEYEQAEDKNLFCWLKSLELPEAATRIRNTSIGTLLIDLSNGVDLDVAVTKFEKVVAPHNYKRPTALVTPAMVENAKSKLAELGLLESLYRRFANETDLSTQDIIYSDKSSALKDVFDIVAKETLVNPKMFSKVEEIEIEDFIANVVPNAKSIEALVENPHLANFVSLVTGIDKTAPSLFKWDNLFSWDYTGGLADSIKERVKAAGGKVDGELRISLSWFNYDDLDLHVVEPDGNEIDYSAKHSNFGGLDVDMNAGHGQTRNGVENVIFVNKPQEGKYKIKIHNFAKRETDDSGYQVQVECKAETFDFEFKQSPGNQEYADAIVFTYSKENGVTFENETKSQVVSKQKWNVKTNNFVKVNKLMLSPNHWGQATGNKHYLFFLEGCISDETPRPFFNEFLNSHFDENRKVFEIIASKLKVEPDTHQLSGLGFSETQRNHLFVKVDGNFKRVLKVKF